MEVSDEFLSYKKGAFERNLLNTIGVRLRNLKLRLQDLLRYRGAG